MDVTRDEARPGAEAEAHRVRRIAGRIARGLGLLVAGVLLGLVLLSAVSAWNARRELRSVHGQLSSLRVQELRDRVTPLLSTDAQRARADKVFDRLDEAALEGLVDLDETYRLRTNLDEALADLTLTETESAAFFELADSLAD